MDLAWILKPVIYAILFYLVICLYIVFYLVSLVSIKACSGDTLLERLVFGPMLILLNIAAVASFTGLWSTALSEFLRN